jgi:hypothetical protein
MDIVVGSVGHGGRASGEARRTAGAGVRAPRRRPRGRRLPSGRALLHARRHPPLLPPAAGDAARWRSATNTTRSGTHDIALGLSRANFVDLNRTRDSGAVKRCSLFGYALCYLFSVLTRSETHDHATTRARAATRPPNAQRGGDHSRRTVNATRFWRNTTHAAI